jgi:hypothetical protein
VPGRDVSFSETPRFVVIDDTITTWGIFDNELNAHVKAGLGKFEAERLTEQYNSGEVDPYAEGQ